MRDSNFFFSSNVRYHEDDMPDEPESDAEEDEFLFDEDEYDEPYGDPLFADLKMASLKMLDHANSDDMVYVINLPYGLKLRMMLLRYPASDSQFVQFDPQYIE